MMKRALLPVVMILWVAGCASTGPVSGTVPAATVGRPFEDFAFVDQHGAKRWFRNVLGDVTVLAFTRSDQGTHTPPTKILESMMTANRWPESIQLVCVDVHWSKSGCGERDRAHVVQQADNLVTICDATGAIHLLYGAGEDNCLYLISSEHKVAYAAPIAREAEFRAQLQAMLEKLAKRRQTEAPRG
jgi:hypothetical protein